MEVRAWRSPSSRLKADELEEETPVLGDWRDFLITLAAEVLQGSDWTPQQLGSLFSPTSSVSAVYLVKLR